MNLDILIKPEVELHPEERRELDALLAEAFSDDPDPGYEWAQPTVHVLGRTNGRLASYAGILEREILAGGEKMLVAGISDVATRADCQRQGLARRVMLAAGNHLRKANKFAFVMLFCNPPLAPFYESCGFRLAGGDVFITSGERRFRIDEIKMVMALDGTPWPDGEIDLQGLPWKLPGDRGE